MGVLQCLSRRATARAGRRRFIVPTGDHVVCRTCNQGGICGDMVSVEERQLQPSLTVMRVTVCVQDTQTEDSRFDGRNRPLPIIILIRDQHVFDVGGMIRDIRGRVPPPKEEFDDQTHWKFDDVAVGLAAQKKAKRITAKLGKQSPPA
jgi:hypothetical protein